jgi:hypothetical protein
MCCKNGSMMYFHYQLNMLLFKWDSYHCTIIIVVAIVIIILESSFLCGPWVLAMCIAGVWIRFSGHSPNCRVVQNFHLPSQKTTGPI